MVLFYFFLEQNECGVVHFGHFLNQPYCRSYYLYLSAKDLKLNLMCFYLKKQKQKCVY